MKIAGAEAAIVYRAGAEQKLVDRARELQAETSAGSWELADIYVSLKAKHNWTQERIAKECDTDQPNVSRCMAVATKYVLVHKRPLFRVAYDEIQKKTAHVSQNTGQVEWYTPPEFIEAARLVLGGIDLDPASSKVAQRTVKASEFYTVDDDGLSKEWAGNVWMNPPYAAGLVDQFAEKLVLHHTEGDVPMAIMLVNNSTDTGWFQTVAKVATAICFPNGRIKFHDENGDPKGAPLQGQAILYLGSEPHSFVRTFGEFGFCGLLETNG